MLPVAVTREHQIYTVAGECVGQVVGFFQSIFRADAGLGTLAEEIRVRENGNVPVIA